MLTQKSKCRNLGYSRKIIQKKEKLIEKFKDIKKPLSPKIVGEVNKTLVKIAIIHEDKIPWHNHKNEDELFYILEENLLFEIERRDSFIMNKGDLFIVKKGGNHRVSSIEPCKIMLIENKTTAHTGDIKTDIPKSLEEQK